jgi:hypothetical protein
VKKRQEAHTVFFATFMQRLCEGENVLLLFVAASPSSARVPACDAGK